MVVCGEDLGVCDSGVYVVLCVWGGVEVIITEDETIVVGLSRAVTFWQCKHLASSPPLPHTHTLPCQ